MSLFNLKSSLAELDSSNAGMSRLRYQKVASHRSVDAASFSGSPIKFEWNLNGVNWWVPKRSYIRMRCRIVDGTAAPRPLTVANDIAPSMNFAANMFQRAGFEIADNSILEINNFVGQVDILRKRMMKSKSWLDSVGASTNFMQASFAERQAQITTDGQQGALGAPNISNGQSLSDLGFDGAVGAHQYAYTAATGLVEFSRLAGGVLPDIRTIFKVGDYFAVPTLNNGVLGSVNQALRIITIDDNTDMKVESPGGSLPADIGATDILATAVRFRVGECARQVQDFEVIWQPPLSIFDIDHALPAGNYRLILEPYAQDAFQRRCVESINAGKTPGVGNDFQVLVDQIHFYVAQVEGPRVDNVDYLIDLTEQKMVSRNLTSSGGEQKQFSVSPSTFALTVAYQDTRISSSTLASPAQMRSYGPTATFGLKVPEELDFTRFQIDYAGQQRPNNAVDQDLSVRDPATVTSLSLDHAVQRYSDTLLETNSYFNAGGSELLQEWRERGAYYHFNWNRDGSDRETSVEIDQTFPLDPSSMNVLLMSHTRRIATVQIRNGRVVGVSKADA